MARKVQTQPMFIPQTKAKDIKLSVDIDVKLESDLKLYNTFLKEQGHDSKFDKTIEAILRGIYKDKIFMKWASETKTEDTPQRGASALDAARNIDGVKYIGPEAQV